MAPVSLNVNYPLRQASIRTIQQTRFASDTNDAIDTPPEKEPDPNQNSGFPKLPVSRNFVISIAGGVVTGEVLLLLIKLLLGSADPTLDVAISTAATTPLLAWFYRYLNEHFPDSGPKT